MYWLSKGNSCCWCSFKRLLSSFNNCQQYSVGCVCTMLGSPYRDFIRKAQWDCEIIKHTSYQCVLNLNTWKVTPGTRECDLFFILFEIDFYFITTNSVLFWYYWGLVILWLAGYMRSRYDLESKSGVICYKTPFTRSVGMATKAPRTLTILIYLSSMLSTRA